MEKVYLIHARAQSGKDTAATCMKQYYEQRGKRVIIIAFADYVKYVLEKYYNTPHERTIEYRTRIQEFATDQVRFYNPNFWVYTVAELLYCIRDDFDIAIIPDWRFMNEYTTLNLYMEEIGASITTVLIIREKNNDTDNMTETQRNHQSECELDNYKNFDYTIINKTDFINDFFTHIKTMIEEIENDSRE